VQQWRREKASRGTSQFTNRIIRYDPQLALKFTMQPDAIG
jgi:hypothetical protein